MKDTSLCLLILLSIKSTLTANVPHKFKGTSEASTYKDSRLHLRQPLRILNENAVNPGLPENETVVTVSSSDSTGFDDNGSQNQFYSPTDSTPTDTSSSSNVPLIVTAASTVDTPINAPLVRNNTGVVPLGGKCSFASKCAGDHVECHLGICACAANFEEHQNLCVETGSFARLREACDPTNRKCIGEFTFCRDGICTCIDGFYSNYDKYNSCIERTMNHVETPKTDPTMIGVVVGLALMSVTLCVVMRLFAKARFRENRTIFNTANPRLMNVTLKKGSKHGGTNRGRRGSQVSIQSGECEEGSQQNERYADNGASTTTAQPVKESSVAVDA